MSVEATAAAAGAGIPPLSISAGPSGADGHASGAANGATGEFFFGGRRNDLADVAMTVAPALILAGAIFWAMRR